MDEIKILDYLSIQKEKVSTCLKEVGYNPNDKVNVFYHHIAEREEEARSRKLTQLVNGTRKKCEKYLEYADNNIQKQIVYLFGEDSEKEVHILMNIHENIMKIIEETECMEITEKSFLKNQYFGNLLYKQFCPVCSNMVDCYKTGMMKKFVINERCCTSKKTCSLTFTTMYEGTWVRVTVKSACPGCCHNSDSFNITSVPTIENINDYGRLLIDNPSEFVEKILIGWIKRFLT